MTAIIFMPGNRGRRQHPRPKRGRVRKSGDAQRLERVGRDADILDMNAPAATPARIKEMAGLSPEEGHGLIGRDSLAENSSCGAGNP